jgi:large repetitive protein
MLAAMEGAPRRIGVASAWLLVQLLAISPPAVVAAAAGGEGPECGQVVERSIQLHHDLVCQGNGLRIGRDGIAIDLAGHKITAYGDYAIGNVGGHDGVRILDGNLVSYGTAGVVLDGAHRNHVIGIRVTGDPDWAFVLHGGAGNYLRHDHGDFVNGGIDLVNSDRNRITRTALTRIAFTAVVLDHANANAFRRNELDGDGPAELVHSNRNVFSRNSNASNPGLFGVQLWESNANRFVHNVFYAGESAVALRHADARNVIRGNTLGGDELALLARDSSRNRIVHNTATGGLLMHSSYRDEVRRNAVSDAGIAIANSVREMVGGNTVTAAIADSAPTGGDGIVVAADARLTTVVNNFARANADDGIDADSPTTMIARNTANNNGDLGIEAVRGVRDGGGNRAAGNGNPLQCTGVLCR